MSDLPSILVLCQSTLDSTGCLPIVILHTLCRVETIYKIQLWNWVLALLRAGLILLQIYLKSW